MPWYPYNLKDYVKQYSKMTIREAFAKQVITKLVEILIGIHAKGIIHFDLKAKNVMLEQGEEVNVYLVGFK
jgi:serine/threonine protein kinase